MAFINDTTSTGIVLNYLTYNVTGDLFTTLLLILIGIIAFALTFRIPLEFTVPIVMPMLIVFMAFSGQFLAIGGVMLIFMAIIFAKMFFINQG